MTRSLVHLIPSGSPQNENKEALDTCTVYVHHEPKVEVPGTLGPWSGKPHRLTPTPYSRCPRSDTRVIQRPEEGSRKSTGTHSHRPRDDASEGGGVGGGPVSATASTSTSFPEGSEATNEKGGRTQRPPQPREGPPAPPASAPSVAGEPRRDPPARDPGGAAVGTGLKEDGARRPGRPPSPPPPVLLTPAASHVADRAIQRGALLRCRDALIPAAVGGPEAQGPVGGRPAGAPRRPEARAVRVGEGRGP